MSVSELAYPIGRFEAPAVIDGATREALVAHITALAAREGWV